MEAAITRWVYHASNLLVFAELASVTMVKKRI